MLSCIVAERRRHHETISVERNIKQWNSISTTAVEVVISGRGLQRGATKRALEVVRRSHGLCCPCCVHQYDSMMHTFAGN